MKVLFLSVTAGYGHNQAAAVVMEYLKERNVSCVMLDTYEYINPILSESVAKGYLISTKFTPSMYRRLYRLAEKREKINTKFSITNIINSILSKKMITFLKEYAPDAIVCTHIFAAQIVSHLKKKGMITAKTVGIITDFTIHPFWEDTDMDCYVTASELLNHQLSKKGIDIGKVKAVGIPIHSRFQKKTSRKEARKILGIEDKTTIFVVSGSMGYGKVIDIIRQLDKLDLDFQIVSVCGQNKVLKNKIDRLKTAKKIYNYGFVDNMDLIMDASTCIITKPGGLTVSESLAKGLPMILANPIPGQEERNVEFLINNGLAVKTSNTYPIDEAVYQLITNGWRRKYLEAVLRSVGKPNSSKVIGDMIIKMVSERQ